MSNKGEALCWNCSAEAESPLRDLSAESEAVLAIEAGLHLETESRFSSQDAGEGCR